jgi:serine/threonine protein kinase
MALEPGQIIDAKYRVIRRIGEGGMGTVYEGENSRIGRRVAIKVLHAQVAAMPDFVERFEREARAAARIGSPHVCDVLDLGDLPSGDRYIVMEYLDGVSFEDRLAERGKLTTSQLAPIAFELLEGLGTMHVARVIHRDLKPANVFLARTPGGRGEIVKILDFGVAKLLPFAGEVGTMTQTGTMMGTPLYMSPEQARGARDVDARTDIYAASVMFYRALAGTLPYNADTLNELLFKIVLEDPKPLRELAPEVDEVFASIVHKGLARDITQRYETARQYQEAIAAWGKAQGRTSLSFAVTHASEPPATPVTLPDRAQSGASAPGTGPVVAASAAVGAVSAANGGTPIAWSEDGSAPKIATAKRSAQTVLTPVGLPAAPAASAVDDGLISAARAKAKRASADELDALGSTAPSGSTLASSSGSSRRPSGSDEVGTPAVAQGTTSPSAPVPDARRGAPVTAATAKSPRGLIAGIVGAGAVAVVALLAFGRTGDKPVAAGLTPVASAATSSDSTLPGDANGARPPAVAESASAASAGTPVPSASASSASASSASAAPSSSALLVTTPARHDGAAPTATTAARKPDPTAKATSTTSASPSATASSAATTPATAASTPKPAGSARKFRTNLD